MPTNDSSLLSLIAAKMVLPGTDPSYPYLAMATLITPELAITPNHVFGNRNRTGQTVKLHFDGRTDLPIDIEATVVAHDSKFDFAVLKLKSGFQINLPSQTLSGENPPNGASWQSLIITPATPKGEYVTGTVSGLETIDGIPHLRLLASRKSEAGASGAPIVVNDRIVGIMARSAGTDRRANNPEDNQWFAIPVSVMLQSKEGDLIRSAMASGSPSPEMDHYRRLSAHAFDTLSLADGIRARMQRDSVHMEHLIAALFGTDNGPAQKIMAEARVDRDKIFEILSEHAKQRFRSLDRYTPTRLTSLPPLSRHARQAMEMARDMANEYSSREILRRHLLYGVLSVTDCDLVKRLLELGLDKDKIAMRDADAAGGPLMAGTLSDAAKGEDLLGISREVEALCLVLADKEMTPPLAIGLFGDWGSGKSFFMRQMERRINTLQEEAAKDNNLPYCRNIVQLWFNAWHYIDIELWASLASEIFDGLAASVAQQEAVAKGTSDPAYERASLLAQSAGAKSELADAEQELSKKQDELNKNRRQLEELERGETGVEISLPRAILEASRLAARHPQVLESVERAKEEFDKEVKKVVIELGTDAETVKNQLAEAHGLWQMSRALWQAARNVKNNWRVWIISIGVLTALFAGSVYLLRFSQDPVWRKPLFQVMATLVPILGWLMPFVYKARSGLRILNRAIETNRKFLEEERLKKEQELQELHRKLQGELAAQEQDVAKKNEEVKRLNEQLENLSANRQITNFIKQRKGSADYTRYQGVIARAHADFEQLSDLLKKEREQREQAARKEADQKTELLPGIDRIILYIDDLDRCPENRVVEVLQAVHLLLAFPLFIVVVGVDSRWLLHSLKQHSSVFRENKGEDAQLTEEGKHWRSTPLNYLEKIFQIPFTLRPMEKRGFEELIDAMAAPQKTPPPVKTETKPEIESLAAEDKAEPGEAKPAGEQAAHIEPPPTLRPIPTPEPIIDDSRKPEVEPAAKINPEHLRIEDWEREVMKKLFPLIPSPRAAKRFVNIYRLLRVSAPAAKRAAFIGDEEHGQHRAALALLAILIGYPDEATEVLRGLLEQKQTLRQRKVEWWRFLQQFDPDTANNKGTGPDAGSPQAAEAERWRELMTKLEETGLIHTHQSCDDFIEWAEEVARYSFQSGRVLLGRQQAQDSAI